MTKTNVAELANALRSAGVPPPYGADISRFLVQLFRRLGEGRPISREEVKQIASNLDIAENDAFSFLSRTSELDSEGSIVGLIGLSLKRHPHRLQVNGQEFTA